MLLRLHPGLLALARAQLSKLCPCLFTGPHGRCQLEAHRQDHRAPCATVAMQGLTTQRTRAVGDIVKVARRAILCTGTPAMSHPVELFAQASWVMVAGVCVCV